MTPARYIAASLLLISSIACGPRASTTSAPPVTRGMKGKVLDVSGQPFSKQLKIRVYPEGISVPVGNDGSFQVSLTPARYLVQIGGPEFDAYVLRRPEERYASESPRPVELEVGLAVVDLGTLYAESLASQSKRVGETYGPFCEQASAGDMVDVPAGTPPFRLMRGLERWGVNSDLPLPPPQFSGICAHSSERRVGSYEGGKEANEVTWDIAAIMADGHVMRKQFRQPPPRQIRATKNLLTGEVTPGFTGQEGDLGQKVEKWLKGSLRQAEQAK